MKIPDLFSRNSFNKKSKNITNKIEFKYNRLLIRYSFLQMLNNIPCIPTAYNDSNTILEALALVMAQQ